MDARAEGIDVIRPGAHAQVAARHAVRRRRPRTARANASSRIYSDGRRASELEFADGSYQGRAGLRVQTSHSRTDISVLALEELISGPVDEATRVFWNRPYGGIGVAESLRFARSENPIRSRFEGVKVTASGQHFFGDETRWRGQLTVDGGAWLGQHGVEWLRPRSRRRPPGRTAAMGHAGTFVFGAISAAFVK